MTEKTLTDLISDLSDFQESLETAYANRPDVKDAEGNSVEPLDFPSAFNTLQSSMQNISQSLSSGGSLKSVANKPANFAAPGNMGDFFFEAAPMPGFGGVGEPPKIYLCIAPNFWVKFEVSTAW